MTRTKSTATGRAAPGKAPAAPAATRGRTRRAAAEATRPADEPPAAASTASGPPADAADTGIEGARRALAIALEKKALEPVLLDVRSLCSFCNYQLVVSGRSDRQVDAIADGISAGLKHEGLRPLGSEGARTGQWALLDYGDFVVHVFLHAAREHYDLEGLWSDAPRVAIEVPAEARLPLDRASDLRDRRDLTEAVAGAPR
jgi:ribosome-associated protein